MNFLKNLFGGSGSSSGDKNTHYVYVQPKMCQEIIKVRIDTARELSRTDDYSGYWVRKMVSATRCPFQAEVTLYFDEKRHLQSEDITNGSFKTQAEYEMYVGDDNVTSS
ncbi:MAG: hypothetical protein AAFR81_25330 [Chloroflexota bacterium]